MKVKMPEPAGQEVTFLEKKLNGEQFTKEGLEKFLQEIEGTLDKGVEKLKSKEFSLVDYQLIFITNIKTGEHLGDLVMGGFYPAAFEEARGDMLGRLKENYKMSFQKVRKEYTGQRLYGDLHLVAVRDTISREIEAQDPRDRNP